MYLLRLLLLISVLILSAMHPVAAQYRILYRSQDLTTRSDQDTVIYSDTTDRITAIESRGILSKYLIVRYAHSKRKLIAKNAIWGFIDPRGAIWRSFEKELFLVIKYNGGWVEYVIERPVRIRLTPTYGAIMYSRTLDSKIRLVWSDAMADAPLGYIVH